MKLVIITKRYDSTVTKQKVQPTPLNAEGKPVYAIYLSDERAQALIDAGVAESYVTDDSIVDDVNADSNTDVTDTDTTDTNEGNADADSNTDVTDDESTETKPKSSTKKSKASK